VDFGFFLVVIGGTLFRGDLTSPGVLHQLLGSLFLNHSPLLLGELLVLGVVEFIDIPLFQGVFPLGEIMLSGVATLLSLCLVLEVTYLGLFLVRG